VGEARLTAHGSAGVLLPGDAPPAGTGVAGAVIDAVGVVVAWGVFATVESPEPQPVSVTATRTPTVSGSAGQGSDHTSRNRTGIRLAGATGVPRPAVLGSRSPLGPMVVTHHAQLCWARDHHWVRWW
jgi:hypothetical protein